MALVPKDDRHANQINAGTIGRTGGHKFEELLAESIDLLVTRTFSPLDAKQHLMIGNPAIELLQYISTTMQLEILDVKAAWLGGLATARAGSILFDEAGHPITASKSDVLLEITTPAGKQKIGVSVKSCNKATPTNAQMYFTTAVAFCELLRNNGIPVSDVALQGLRMFCGDAGFRPTDLQNATELRSRLSDPSRYYWEEMPKLALYEWNQIFAKYQDEITRLLFQKAYKSDPYAPSFLLHQTVKYDTFDAVPMAIFSMDEIVSLSRRFSEFTTSAYTIKKGTFKNDPNVHQAPRFGFIQFQRGGQRQHPTQLQFNLKSGYFNRLPN